VRAAPPEAAGFAVAPRALTEAIAAEAAGRPADVDAACRRAEATGFTSLDLLALHIRALHALGRPAEAGRLTRRLRDLAPYALTERVPSPFRASP
jgi:hypothetical protein